MYNLNMRITTQTLVLVMIVGCASVPDLSNDPRTGGLAGVVSGELRGDYEARVREREARRDRLMALEEQLKEKRRDLEQNKKAQEQILNAEQAKLARLENDAQNLRRTVSELESRTQIIEAQKNTLLSRIYNLEVEIKQIETTGEAETLRQCNRLEQELSDRMREYELLRKRNDLMLR